MSLYVMKFGGSSVGDTERMKRVAKRNDRPLLKEDDPHAVMQRLMDERYPIYAEADLTVETGNAPHNSAVKHLLDALRTYLQVEQ